MSSYEEIDNEISEISDELKCHPDQIGYARRGELYGQRALVAMQNNNAYLTESSLRTAVKDYSVALEEGDRDQLAKAEWYQQRGTLYKLLAGVLPAGNSRSSALQEALRDFSNTLLIMHITPAMMFARAEVRLALGMYESAIDDYTSAIPSSDNKLKIDSLHGRSEAWLSLHDNKSAYADLSTAIQASITSHEGLDVKQLARLLYSRAKVAKLINNFDSCLADVSKALQLVPDFVEALEMRASVCYSLGMLMFGS
eukprot:TRINITY_DN1921_c0_g1_i3.p1 TRINITY_DN1921_c0_g1~~TRINITY_DN1921_c0_g1_i3.p1  ORF type:complete len:255 (+),score=65.02 TRINITY_DN1921_c0_g1_i3:1047-1811(+)